MLAKHKTIRKAAVIAAAFVVSANMFITETSSLSAAETAQQNIETSVTEQTTQLPEATRSISTTKESLTESLSLSSTKPTTTQKTTSSTKKTTTRKIASAAKSTTKKPTTKAFTTKKTTQSATQKQTTTKKTTTTKKATTTKKTTAANKAEHYWGVLKVPSANLTVDLYSILSQSVTDKTNAASIFEWWPYEGAVIADHCHQEFKHLFEVSVGTTGTIETKDGETIRIKCVQIVNGYNTGTDLVDKNRETVFHSDTDYIMYTCRDTQGGVLICFWDKY